MFFFQVLIGTPVLALFSFGPNGGRMEGFRQSRADDGCTVVPNPPDGLRGLIDTHLCRHRLDLLPGRALVHWQVELHDDALLLGWIGHATRISYDDVTFFRRGTLSDRLEQGEGRIRTMPVQIEFLPHKEYPIWLETNDAGGLFKNLRDRCAHAAAVNVDGTQYAPLVDQEAWGPDVSRVNG